MSNIVVVTTTLYRSISELRFSLACDLVKKATDKNFRVFVVDGSQNPEISEALKSLGAYVQKDGGGGMGSSKRQVFKLAQKNCSGDSVVVWTEPEKNDIIRSIPQATSPILRGDLDVAVFSRSSESWNTYPSFQRESERAANSVYSEVMNAEMDPMFGPVAFSFSASHLVTDFVSEQYGVADNYVQHYAPIWAKSLGFRVGSVVVDFKYPAEQKQEESSELLEAMLKKRQWQREQLVSAYVVLGKKLFV